MANFGFYRDEHVTDTFRDYDSIGAIKQAWTIGGRLKMLLVVDRAKMRETPAKNVRHRWQLVSCDQNQRYCRTFRSYKEALTHFDALTYKR